MASKLSLFLAELKRRKVYNVEAVYAAVGVAISVAVPDLFGAFGFPSWAAPLVIVVILMGCPIALVLAWAYEVEPEEQREAETVPITAIDTPESERRKSIVVLPFDNMSPDPGDAYFADGLTEEIITHLSHIRSLRVISRNSAMALKGTQKSTRAIAEELDVQHVLEGSVRKAGDDLRITAQMISDSPDHILTSLGRFLKCGWLGEREQALEAVTDELETGARWDDMWPLLMADAFALIDEKERAFSWLEHAIAMGMTNVKYLGIHDPFLASLRADERFGDSMKRAQSLSDSFVSLVEIEELL